MQADAPQWDYWKYHGLGNDYLVMEPGRFGGLPELPEQTVRAICDRNRGVGGDGILWGPLGAGEASPPALIIYNPDGSQAQKSGNGLRIFARHLWQRGWAATDRFSIASAGGLVGAEMLASDGSNIAMEMGQVRFESSALPMTGPPREVLRQALELEGEAWTINAASVGNPHCVVLLEGAPGPTPELAHRIGPLIERHPLFPERTNVQFMAVRGPNAIQIEIWERGAGYTLASGSSSCAAAAVACRLGLVQSPVTVHMPGGTLEIRLDDAWHARMVGPVAHVCQGNLSDGMLAELGLRRGQ